MKPKYVMEPPVAWMWEKKNREGNWEICYWIQPELHEHELVNKPSDDARSVCVRLVRNSSLRTFLVVSELEIEGV